jgi:alkylation response protein AidB-like acyl-CoA dehydrogenase
VNFGFTEEQDLLRQEVRRFLDGRCPLETVRGLVETPEGFSSELWKEIAALGWIGLTIPEPYGGAGLGWVDLIVILEETGRTLFPSPLIATTLAAAALIRGGSEAQQQRHLPGLAGGTTIGTVALLEESDALGPEAVSLRGIASGSGFQLSGTKCFVMDADAAGLFVVAFRTGDAPDDIALAVIRTDTRGVTTRTFPVMDQTKRLGNVVLADVEIGAEEILCRGPRAAALLGTLQALGAVAVTAEAIGAAEGAHRITVDYAKERTQFGRPIGQYQAVKHPLAEMYVDIESFKSLLYHAAWAADEEPSGLERAAAYAKAYASEAFARIGIDGVQLHGAVGYTDEFDVQLYLKRAKWARSTFGDADYHYDRLAALGGL